MKIFIWLFVAVFALGVLAKRPVFKINTLGWQTRSSSTFPLSTLASSKDLLVYYDTSEESKVAVRRRNSEGGYDLVANITQVVNPYVHTAHGKWVWIDQPCAISKIDENNQVSGPIILGTSGSSMLSDDTFVTYAFDGTTYQLVTYEYQSAINNWTLVAGAELEVQSPVYVSWDMQSYRAYDNHLVVADRGSSSVKIYQRQADKSWKLNDTITVASAGTTKVGVHFNGVDTVLFVVDNTLSDSSHGTVYIYTKKNGAWSQQMFNTSSVGYIGQTNLGASCAFIDQNTLLLSAGTADFYSKSPTMIGKVLMMTRTNGGDWAPYMDIIGDDSDVFGMSIAVNDYDLVVHDVAVGGLNPTGRFRVYAVPLCFAQPLNITCNNEQVSDCSSLSQAQLYTVNQSPRCGEVSLSLNGVSLIDQKLQASFTFTRFEIESFSCNATVTCPAPVVSVPVKAPTAKTSDGAMIQCFSLAVLSLYLAIF